MCDEYSIEKHIHRLAAWAATRAIARAVSVKGYSITVENGVSLLANNGFNDSFSLNDLPKPNQKDVDKMHKKWRDKIKTSSVEFLGKSIPNKKSSSKKDRKKVMKSEVFTDGIAAKLINCYLKIRFVCSGKHEDDRVKALHPPVDRQLLGRLAEKNSGGHEIKWREYEGIGWSNFNSEQYSDVITLIRESLNGQPLWKIEKYWPGYK